MAGGGRSLAGTSRRPSGGGGRVEGREQRTEGGGQKPEAGTDFSEKLPCSFFPLLCLT